jgi:transposase
VFHSKDERIRAHALICFLALVIVRVAETRTGESWRTIRAELSTIRQGLFRSKKRRVHPNQQRGGAETPSVA